MGAGGGGLRLTAGGECPSAAAVVQVASRWGGAGTRRGGCFPRGSGGWLTRLGGGGRPSLKLRLHVVDGQLVTVGVVRTSLERLVVAWGVSLARTAAVVTPALVRTLFLSAC